MPGKLRDDAWCPVCGRDLLALFRTTKMRWGRAVTELEFIHRPEDYRLPHAVRGEDETMQRIHDRLHAAAVPLEERRDE